MTRGKLVVIEGGEGSGKSSAVSWLKSELGEEGVLFTREPGGTENAEEIRELLLKKRTDPLDVVSQLLLFEAVRREHVLKKIAPALEVGVHVVCDRFSASTYAYQIVAGAGVEYKDFFLTTDTLVKGGIEPDHTVFLDVTPEVGLARRAHSGEALNVFDEQSLTFHRAVQHGIAEYLRDRPHTVIDADKPQQEVREEVKRVMLSVLNYG